MSVQINLSFSWSVSHGYSFGNILAIYLWNIAFHRNPYKIKNICMLAFVHISRVFSVYFIRSVSHWYIALVIFWLYTSGILFFTENHYRIKNICMLAYVHVSCVFSLSFTRSVSHWYIDLVIFWLIPREYSFK